ncbi:MAG: Type 1 glutamine amidotransferase-like domain-containing protein, partial [Bacilli bacterium]|nr:Type 1 glutamine amidotransferase-like domain-containing protein [Bacilli bacterium]
GLVDQIKKCLTNNNSILFIASDYEDYEKVDSYSALLFEAFRLSGIEFSTYHTLDERNKEDACKLVNGADFIFLSGGDAYVQHQFFESINLRELLKEYDGILMGQSAGSLNMASSVFNSPEEMEGSEPIYFEGLGVTDINIEPHFVLNEAGFSNEEIYQRRYIERESNLRAIYAVTDGSHIFIDDDNIVAQGEIFLIKDEVIAKICENKEKYIISDNFVL